MRLLYLVPKTIYDTKMSRVRFQQVRAIGRLASVHISGLGWPDWIDTATPLDNAHQIAATFSADLILSYKVRGLHGCRVPCAVSFNEAYDVDDVESEVHDGNARLVIFHHGNDLPRYQHWDARGIMRVHIPHGADTDMFRDYGHEKNIDILVVGNRNQSYYPLRYRLATLAQTYFARRAWRVVRLPHPGYTLPARDGTMVGESYARMLNRAKLVFTCSMIYKYALAKYSEIGCARSVAVADVPSERQAFFRETILNVESWMTDAQICDIVETALDPESGVLDPLLKHSYARNLAESTLDLYAQRFIEAAREFLEGPRPC